MLALARSAWRPSGRRLRKLGWIEGKNFTIESRFGEEKTERLAELAADLVRLKVDVIVCASTAAALAAKKATTTIPIVMANSADPVGAGLVASLAQPGGNVTGMSGLSVELNTKRLEVLKDAVPKLDAGWDSTSHDKPRRCFRRTSNERSQGCGCGTQTKIGGDRPLNWTRKL